MARIPVRIQARIQEDPEVRSIRESLRTAVERSLQSPIQLEQSLGLSGGTLDAIFTGKRELGVAHLFGLVRALGIDLWQVLLREPLAKRRRTGENSVLAS